MTYLGIALAFAAASVLVALGWWLGWAFGYRRGIDDTIDAHREARDDYYETMERVSRR